MGARQWSGCVKHYVLKVGLAHLVRNVVFSASSCFHLEIPQFHGVPGLPQLVIYVSGRAINLSDRVKPGITQIKVEPPLAQAWQDMNPSWPGHRPRLRPVVLTRGQKMTLTPLTVHSVIKSVPLEPACYHHILSNQTE